MVKGFSGNDKSEAVKQADVGASHSPRLAKCQASGCDTRLIMFILLDNCCSFPINRMKKKRIASNLFATSA